MCLARRPVGKENGIIISGFLVVVVVVVVGKPPLTKPPLGLASDRGLGPSSRCWKVQGKILHTRSHKNENPLEHATDNPLEDLSRNPLDK